MAPDALASERTLDIARSLRIIRRDLESLIAPELSSAAAQSSLAMIVKVMEMLAQELASGSSVAMPATAAASAQATLARSAQDLDRLLSRTIAEQAVAGGDAQAALLGLLEAASASSLVAADTAVWQGYDALAAARAIRDAGVANTNWDASYQESGAGAGSATAQARSEREFTAAELTAYLVESGRAERGVQVSRLQRLPGGFSKGTYLVELEGASATRQSWVLRRDLSFTPLQTQVVDEFPLLSTLYQLGLPVPEPLWCEADATCLGAPLIAVRRIAGSGDMTQWAQRPEQARVLARESARLLARIHGVDLQALPKMQTHAPGSSGDTPLAVIARVEAFWQAVRIEPDPLVELLFAWLRRHVPQPGSRTLVHGDYGLHNLLVEDGRITAVLDWEFAHVGDPREDLAYARPFVEKVLPWPEFVHEYEAAGGATCDDEALRFYTVLGTLRNALGCMKVLHALRHGDPGIDAKFIYAGRSYAQQMLRSAAQLTGMLASSTSS